MIQAEVLAAPPPPVARDWASGGQSSGVADSLVEVRNDLIGIAIDGIQFLLQGRLLLHAA